MAAIKDIVVNVIDGVINATGVNFGVPILLGFVGSRAIVKWGSGVSGIVAKSVARNGDFNLEVIVSGAVYDYDLTGSDLVITVPVGARVRDLLADFAANAPGPVLALVSLAATGTGSGPVLALAATDSNFLLYQEVRDLAQLAYYYDSTDLDYKLVKNILASAPSPNVVYLLNCFGITEANIGAHIQLRDDGKWFMVLTGSTTEAMQQAIADYVNAVDRVALFCSNTDARLDAVKGDNIAYLIHDAEADHPEVSWAAKNLPNVPSVGWKFTSNLYGQVPNATADLTDLLNVRNKKGQSYVSANGVAYVDGSQINSQSSQLYIDQAISRKWIKINLQIDLLNLFLQAAAQGSKIPYTDSGINQILSVIETRLNNAGKLGIIAPVETTDQAKVSADGQFRFKVTSLSRTEIETSQPADIVGRVLTGVKYEYIEAGAIERIDPVTGVILLTEG